MPAAGASQDAIVPVPYDGTTDGALTAAGPQVTADPQVDEWVVVARDDEGVPGGVDASEDVIAVGLGGDEDCRPRARGVHSGFEAARPPPGTDVGRAAAGALIAGIEDGTSLPPDTVVDVMPAGDTPAAPGPACRSWTGPRAPRTRGPGQGATA